MSEVNQTLDQISVLNNNSKLLIQLKTGYLYQNIIDIVFCKADLAYTEIYVRNQKRPIIVKQSLRLLSSILPDTFFRIHKSYLINLRYVYKIDNNNNDIMLEDGTHLDLARRRKKEFINALLINKTGRY